MKTLRTSYIMIFALCVISLISGCQSTKPYNAEIGTATGAVVGGIAGNALFDGSTAGTIGGAAVGGVAGYEIGKQYNE